MNCCLPQLCSETAWEPSIYLPSWAAPRGVGDQRHALVSLLSEYSSNSTSNAATFIISLLSSRNYRTLLYSPISAPSFSAWLQDFSSASTLSMQSNFSTLFNAYSLLPSMGRPHCLLPSLCILLVSFSRCFFFKKIPNKLVPSSYF